MLFPIGDDNLERGHFPLFSYLLLAANVAIFIFQSTLPSGAQAAFIEHYAAVPAEIVHGVDLQTLFTSIFLHGSWVHLLGNMLYLWIFADNIEGEVGNIRFLIFYLLGGLVAGLAQVFFSPDSWVPCIGASGAIAAVMGAYIVMHPRSRVKMLLFFIWVIYIPAWLFLGFWIFQQFNFGLEASGTDAGGVAWWAHIGGFIFGLVAGIRFRRQFVERPVYRGRY